MDTSLADLRLRNVTVTRGLARALGAGRAAWLAFYFHALPHPLSEILYWDLLYVGVRLVGLLQSLGGRMVQSGDREPLRGSRRWTCS